MFDLKIYLIKRLKKIKIVHFKKNIFLFMTLFF